MKRNKLFLMLLFTFLSMAYSSAQVSRTITVSTPGTLAELIGTDKLLVTDLEVKGNIDATDFKTIREMRLLKNLNLTALTNDAIPDGGLSFVKLNRVVLPMSLTQISNNAFAEATLEEKLIIPESVTTIGERVFNNATLKQELIIPKGVTTLGERVFSRTKFKSIDLTKSSVTHIPPYGFAAATAENGIIDLSTCRQIKSFGKCAFEGSTQKVILPDNLTQLDNEIFAFFRGIPVLPASLIQINYNAFAEAILNEQLIIPESVTTIGDRVFNNTTLKEALVIPKGVTTLGDRVFSRTKVKSIDLTKSSVTHIPPYGFAAATVENGIIDLSTCRQIKSFGKCAFDGSTQKVILPDNLTQLDSEIFAFFRGIPVLPASLIQMNYNAFGEAILNEQLIIPESVTTIGDRVFNNTTLKEALVIPKGVTTLGDRVFWRTKFKSIDLTKSSVTHIPSFGFAAATVENGIINLSTTRQIKSFGKCAFEGSTQKVILPDNLTQLDSEIFAFFRGIPILPTSLIQMNYNAFGEAILNEQLIIPESVTTIGDRVFNNTTLKEALVIPKSVTTLGDRVFWRTKFKSIDLTKSSVTHIPSFGFAAATVENGIIDLSTTRQIKSFGSYAFEGSTQKVILPDNLTQLDNEIFSRFKGIPILPTSLTRMNYCAFADATLEEKLVIPSSVTIIGERVFAFATLKEALEIPKNVTTLGERVFWNTKVKSIDLTKSSVTHIPAHAFVTTTVENGIIDLSTTRQIKSFGKYAFESSTQKVILPDNLTQLDNEIFASFKGIPVLPASLTQINYCAFAGAILNEPLIIPESVTAIGDRVFTSTTLKHALVIPKNVTTLGERVFWNTKVTEILLPASLERIGDNGFVDCKTLEKLTCLNPIPPQLGRTVFAGVDTKNCELIVPARSIELYGTTNQWKDFLNVQAKAEPLSLTFKLKLNPKSYVIDDSKPSGPDHPENVSSTPPPGVPDAGAINTLSMKTKANRIGEYYWTDVFDLDITHFNWWWTTIGNMSRYPLNEELFDLYMQQIHIDYERYTPDYNDFDKYYGKYYDKFTFDYLNSYGVMYEKYEPADDEMLPYDVTPIRAEAGPGWANPYKRDYRQLFAMCPFVDPSNTYLDELDVRAALSYRKGENPLAYNIEDGTSNRVYWFDGYNTNMYDFNMMPGGTRLHATGADWGNGLAYNPNFDMNKYGHLILEHQKYINDAGEECEKWVGRKGQFALMFYTSYYWATDGLVSIHDRVDTGTEGYFAAPARWCRKLTDEELGYKLFIKVNKINTSSVEWQELTKNNEVPLIQQIKRGVYSASDFDIVKINDPKAAAPSGYTELPNGYIRGLYVQYMIGSSNKTISDIILYASRIDDSALDIQLPSTRQTQQTDATESKMLAQSANTINIYPNPAEDILYINSSNAINSLNVYNATGGLVISLKNVTDNSINVSNLAKGIYIIKIETDNNSYTQQLIKK